MAGLTPRPEGSGITVPEAFHPGCLWNLQMQRERTCLCLPFMWPPHCMDSHGDFYTWELGKASVQEAHVLMDTFHCPGDGCVWASPQHSFHPWREQQGQGVGVSICRGWGDHPDVRDHPDRGTEIPVVSGKSPGPPTSQLLRGSGEYGHLHLSRTKETSDTYFLDLGILGRAGRGGGFRALGRTAFRLQPTR